MARLACMTTKKVLASALHIGALAQVVPADVRLGLRRSNKGGWNDHERFRSAAVGNL